MVAAKDRGEPVLAKAEEQKEALVSQGMSVGLLEDLGKSVASF